MIVLIIILQYLHCFFSPEHFDYYYITRKLSKSDIFLLPHFSYPRFST